MIPFCQPLASTGFFRTVPRRGLLGRSIAEQHFPGLL